MYQGMGVLLRPPKRDGGYQHAGRGPQLLPLWGENDCFNGIDSRLEHPPIISQLFRHADATPKKRVGRRAGQPAAPHFDSAHLFVAAVTSPMFNSLHTPGARFLFFPEFTGQSTVGYKTKCLQQWTPFLEALTPPPSLKKAPDPDERVR